METRECQIIQESVQKHTLISWLDHRLFSIKHAVHLFLRDLRLILKIDFTLFGCNEKLVVDWVQLGSDLFQFAQEILLFVVNDRAVKDQVFIVFLLFIAKSPSILLFVYFNLFLARMHLRIEDCWWIRIFLLILRLWCVRIFNHSLSSVWFKLRRMHVWITSYMGLWHCCTEPSCRPQTSESFHDAFGLDRSLSIIFDWLLRPDKVIIWYLLLIHRVKRAHNWNTSDTLSKLYIHF